MARVRQQYTLNERDARRFWSRVLKHGPIPAHRPELGPCWIRQGSHLPSGYSQFHVRLDDGRWSSTVGHRVSWELAVGPIPDGLTLDHLCRYRPCVKSIPDEFGPGHLEPVTDVVNILRGDGWSGQHARTTHCPQGHLYDEANTYVDNQGQRHCRTCGAARAREHRRRKVNPNEIPGGSPGAGLVR
jgi:hypothetical protein